eukprot:5342338-Amphidinium_carterae.1
MVPAELLSASLIFAYITPHSPASGRVPMCSCEMVATRAVPAFLPGRSIALLSPWVSSRWDPPQNLRCCC